MGEPTHVFLGAERVEIDQHRWWADIRIVYADGVTKIRVCAEGEHSGLWLGDPEDHVEF